MRNSEARQKYEKYFAETTFLEHQKEIVTYLKIRLESNLAQLLESEGERAIELRGQIKELSRLIRTLSDNKNQII